MLSQELINAIHENMKIGIFKILQECPVTLSERGHDVEDGINLEPMDLQLSAQNTEADEGMSVAWTPWNDEESAVKIQRSWTSHLFYCSITH